MTCLTSVAKIPRFNAELTLHVFIIFVLLININTQNLVNADVY